MGIPKLSTEVSKASIFSGELISGGKLEFWRISRSPRVVGIWKLHAIILVARVLMQEKG